MSNDDRQYDVAILGSGIAGSTLAAILARNGVRVLLCDAGSHPRFAIGESTIPFTSGMTRILADRYDVPEIRPLSSFRGVQRHVSRNCGRKQNFGFVYHRPDGSQRPDEINQLVVPALLRTESHFFRQDVDQYLYQVAIRYGTDCRPNTRITDVDIDPDRGVVLRSDRGEEFRAAYVVDAGGFRSPLADKLSLREEPTRARVHSRSLFTHMIGVRPFDGAPAAARHRKPNPWHNGTLHHVFDGGWMWVIPFNNHPDSLNPLVSVGLNLDPRVHPQTGESPEREFERFLTRFPDIAWQFAEAKPVRPWVSTGRLQYSAKQVVGERFCLTSHAAGFVDPLYSRGLTNTLELINALAWRLIAAARDGDWSVSRFQYLEELQQGLFDFHDDLVYSSYVAFRDYRLWNAVNRTWQLGTMLGNVVIEDAYYRFTRSGDDAIFLQLEQSRHPGSPFPVSERFSALGVLTRALCEQVEAGTTDPGEAADLIFAEIGQADYLPPSFGFADPGSRCFSATPVKMARNAWWSRRSAPPEVGRMMTRATRGLVRMRLRS